MLLLEQLLQALNIQARPFAVCRVGTNATLPMQRVDDALVHYVIAGRGVLTLRGVEQIDLSPGTMVIVPRRTAHEIVPASDGGPMPPDLRRCASLGSVQVIEAGWGGTGLVLACGQVSATYQGAQGLFDYLPTPIVERAKRGDAIRNAFATLLRELEDPQPGTHEMIGALIRQCLLVILRKHCEKSGVCSVPWLSALEHPRLGRVLQKVLLHPGKPYTLELLAELAGMSRSAFSEQFLKTFGRTAMEFVKETRLRQAAQLLSTTKRPVKAIAAEVGYHSRSHFSQAFKHTYGLDPTAYRECSTRVSMSKPSALPPT